MEQSRRRKPAQERWINELSDQDLQKRIRVLGSIVDIKSIQDQVFAILDDGTKQIQINIKETIPLKSGNHIRVFGILGKNEKDEYIIEAEIIQDMNSLDIEFYKRVQDVKRRFKNSLNTH
ncbi:MAG: hypothetical protein ACFFD2_07520 [Promethearchaeota archaeon]